MRLRFGIRLAAAVLLAASPLAMTAAPAPLQWTLQTSGLTARLRGLSVVSDSVAWASGTGGTVIRTADGGRTWTRLTLPDAERLDFRDIDATGERTAYVLSIGAGPASRIYKTTDAGAHWARQFTSADEKAFFDAMAFWNERRGVAVSDSVDGHFVIMVTANGGTTWERVSTAGLPRALPNEGAFAASGTNVAVLPGGRAWFGTGATVRARVLRTHDYGRSWSIADTPVAAGQTAGIYSIAFADPRRGAIVGGDFQKEAEAVRNAAVTTDGGVTWNGVTGLRGYRSVVAVVRTRPALTLIAAGPTGTDWSSDGGHTWQAVEGPGFHSLAVAPSHQVIYGVGEDGRIGKLVVPK